MLKIDIFCFAARKVQAFFDSTLGYPRPNDGPAIPLPAYDPLSDPHLTEYFYRRFGTIQRDARVSVWIHEQKIFLVINHKGPQKVIWSSSQYYCLGVQNYHGYI